MGLFDKLKEKKEEIEKQKKEEAGEAEEEEAEGKYSESCALCGGAGSDKKWAGQYWHKKCFRSARKMGKKMV